MLYFKLRSDYLLLISNCGILKRAWAKLFHLITRWAHIKHGNSEWRRVHDCMLVLTWHLHLLILFIWMNIYGVPSKCQASYVAQGCKGPGHNGKDGSSQIQGIYGRYSKALVIDLKVKNEAQEDLKANSQRLAEKQWKRRRFSWTEWI